MPFEDCTGMCLLEKHRVTRSRIELEHYFLSKWKIFFDKYKWDFAMLLEISKYDRIEVKRKTNSKSILHR